MALTIKESVERISLSSIAIKIVDMESYMDTNTVTTAQAAQQMAITVGDKHLLNLKPSRFDFDSLKNDVVSSLASASDGKHMLVIVHGLYALYDKDLCDKAQIKVYVGSDADTRLIRWIRRDVLSKETSNPNDLEWVIGTYLYGAREEMRDYIFPTKERADVVLPRGAEANAASLIADGIVSSWGSSCLVHASNILRPYESSYQTKRFDNEKRSYYELN